MLRTPLEGILLLSGNWHAQNRPNSLTLAYVARRTARPLQPLREIAQLDFVFDANVRDRHFDDVEPLGDPGNPCVASNGRETLGYSLI